MWLREIPTTYLKPTRRTIMNQVKKTFPKLSKTEQDHLDNLPTTSARIRYLNSLGWERADIARKLGKLYQHVRNVLEMKVKNPIQ